MYGNVDYVVPARHADLSLKRSRSEQSNIYLQEESIYEPVRGSDKPDPESLWRLSSTVSSGDETTLHWNQGSPTRSSERGLRAAVAVFGLLLILILCILCFFISKYSVVRMELASLREEQQNVTFLDAAQRMEIASLREEQRKLSFLGSFLIFNEDHNKCAEVRPSSSPFELTASGCSSVSHSQFFHWLPGGRLMSTKEGLCVGVEGKHQSQKPLRLFHCDTEKALTWACTNKTLLGIKGENLYFNYGNNNHGIVMLYWGTGPWSRWRAQSLDGKLQDGGACAQSCA